jgi:hypothetical protein
MSDREIDKLRASDSAAAETALKRWVLWWEDDDHSYGRVVEASSAEAALEIDREWYDDPKREIPLEPWTNAKGETGWIRPLRCYFNPLRVYDDQGISRLIRNHERPVGYDESNGKLAMGTELGTPDGVWELLKKGQHGK